MNYKIAVCDDNLTDRSLLLSFLRSWAEQADFSIQVKDFPSAEAFLFAYEEESDYDILLLDIEMKQMDGVTMAKTIRHRDETVQIIFVTGYSDYIAEGYEVAALHYLLKPVKAEKLFEVLDRAVQKCRKNERMLTVKQHSETIRIPFSEIRYLEVCQNYVTIHGKNDYTVKRSLGELATELDTRFFRMGRSYALNLHFVKKVTRSEVHLTDGTVLPLPRGQYDALNRAIITYS